VGRPLHDLGEGAREGRASPPQFHHRGRVRRADTVLGRGGPWSAALVPCARRRGHRARPGTLDPVPTGRPGGRLPPGLASPAGHRHPAHRCVPDGQGRRAGDPHRAAEVPSPAGTRRRGRALGPARGLHGTRGARRRPSRSGERCLLARPVAHAHVAWQLRRTQRPRGAQVRAATRRVDARDRRLRHRRHAAPLPLAPPRGALPVGCRPA